MEKLLFKLNIFEGPLDLMLQLIAKHKLNINDIEISLLLEQYINIIEEMKSADLEVASEFLTMAARLVYIKTVSLLPVNNEGEELKRELEGQLLEYQLCKVMAQKLADRNSGGLIFTREPQKLHIDRTYKRFHDKDELLQAYIMVIGKARRKLPPPKTAFTGIVSKHIVPVESKIVYVLKKLYDTGSVPYAEFFTAIDRSELIATFLAMLELIKSKRVSMSADDMFVIFNKEFGITRDIDLEMELNVDDIVSDFE